jgi:hypothetical protein
LWFCGGVVNLRSTETGADASACSASPLRPPLGIIGIARTGSAESSAAWKSVLAGAAA